MGLGVAGYYLLKKGMKFWRRTAVRDKVVLISGGSRGLGLALALEFGSKGARLAICARTAGQLEKARQMLTAAGYPVKAIQADLSDEAQAIGVIQQVAAHYGHIDILVNNAGMMIVGPENVMDIEDYKEVMAANTWSALMMTRAVLPHFRQHRKGHIVMISSVGGNMAVPHMLPYSVSKFALSGLAQGLHAELRKDNIAVTNVVPGLMRTGSPRNITLKGNHEAGYAWFKIADSLPALSVSAKEAARRIVSAVEYREPEVVLGWTAKAAILMKAVAPGLLRCSLKLAARLLPGSTDTTRKKGYESTSPLSESAVTSTTDSAAIRYNQL